MRDRTQWLLDTYEDLVKDYRQLKGDYEKIGKRFKDISLRVSAARALLVGELDDNPNNKTLEAEIQRIEALRSGTDQVQQPILTVIDHLPSQNGNGSNAPTDTHKKGENTANLIAAMKDDGNRGYTTSELIELLRTRGTPLDRTTITNILAKQTKRNIMRKEGERYYLTELADQYVPNKKTRHLAG